ncbi:MAG: hypothetical protein M3Q39_07405, partial [Actinomycetota bacterium]|nr:hypothetical protein [Actinomycetota bacterium]
MTTIGLVLLAGVPSALADEGYPSQDEVAAAEDRVEDAARDVATIRADLSAAGVRLDDLVVQAAQAAEAYNGARWRLQQARVASRDARRKAERAAAEVARLRDDVGSLVAENYQSGGSLTQVGAYLTSDDPSALIERYTAFSDASDSMQSDLDRFSASDALANVFSDEAARAVQDADDAEAAAAGARQAAADTFEAQQDAVASMEDARDELIRELAEAQDISVGLARQRQEALERIEQRRAQRAAQRAAQREAEAEAQRQAELAAERAAQREALQTAERAAQRDAQREAQLEAQQAAEAAEAAAEAAAQRQAELAAEQEAEAEAAA